MIDLDQYYRVYAKVNLDHIYKNMENMKNNLRKDTQMVAVVKADGYGHGAVQVAKTVDSLVEAYAVATIEEAMELRNHGIEKPIYLLGFIPEKKIETAIENEIRFAVFEMAAAKKISKKAKEMEKNAIIHIKLDTGMGRIGFLPTEKSVQEVVEISKLPNVTVEGIFTHFSKADEKDKEYANRQFEIFCEFNDRLSENGLDIKIKHCANSAAIIDMPKTSMTEARNGIALYGLYPSDEVNKEKVKLYPALELKSHVVYVKEVDKGTQIGYGGTFITKRNSKIATIPVGYGDGYPRNLSNVGSVLIKGKRFPIVGRICMDQFMIDVTDADVCEGDEVTLIGKDGDEVITVEEAAMLSKTFNYEFICDLGKRIPRIYFRDEKPVEVKEYI